MGQTFKYRMSYVMKLISQLLSKFGLNFGVQDRNSRFTRNFCLISKSDSILLFAKKIGFRYDVNKASRLSIASSYQRYKNNVQLQHINLIKETSKACTGKKEAFFYVSSVEDY